MFRFALQALFLASACAWSLSAQEPSLPADPAASAVQSPASSAAASQTLTDAEAAMARQDWKFAEANLNQWLTAHPQDARALFDSGYIADAQNHNAPAEALYRRAIDADPKSFEAHISLGLLLARQGNANDARPELSLATSLDPGEAGPAVKARAWRALARIDRVTDPTEASNDLLEALKLSPETSEDTLLAAAIAERAGEYDAAEKAYRRVLDLDARSLPASIGLAHVLITRKQYADAETLLRADLKQFTDNPVLSAQLATALAAQDKAEALPLLEKLHDAHPNDPDITRMLASVLADAGDYSGSDHYYAALLAATTNDASLFVAHGQNLLHLLRYADAFSAFNKAAQLDQANAEAWSGLAIASSRTHQPDVTLHALTMRSKYLGEVPATYFLWATAYDSLHENGPAASYYEHFLESAAGKFPDQEWQARQRLKFLKK